MPAKTEITEGVHQVKLRSYGGHYSVSLPEELASKCQMFPGGGLITIFRVGQCIVLSMSHYATADDAKREAESKFTKGIEEWQKNGNGKK